MNWTRIAYGTLVAAGLATTGTLVWVSHRPQVKAVDFIQIFQGAQERCLATQYDSGTTLVTAVTNRINLFNADDSSDLVWISYPGGTPKVNHYKAFSGTSNQVITTTNIVHSTIGTIEYSPCRVTPMQIAKNYVTATSNQYIWGPCSNYTVSGSTLHSEVNGDYAWIGRSRGIDEYWMNGTNSAHCVYDLGQIEGDDAGVTCLRIGSAYSASGDGMLHGLWTGADDASNIVVTGSHLMTNIVRGAWVIDRETKINSIDWQISKIKLNELTSRIHSCVRSGWFVDDTLAEDGHFVDVTNLPTLSSTTVWHRCSITYVVTNNEGEVYGIFGDETFTTSGIPVKGTYTTSSSNWTDRAKVLNTMRWTKSGSSGNGLTWTTDDPTNCYYYWFDHSSVSWEDAKSKCEAIGPVKIPVAINQRPFKGTVGTKIPLGEDAYEWRAWAYAYGPRLVMTCSTSIEHSVDYYFRTATFGLGSVSNSTYYDEGLSLSTNYLQYASTVSKTFSGAITNDDFYSDAFPGQWCNEPETNRSESSGFEVINEDAVLKWTFGYCTNSIP